MQDKIRLYLAWKATYATRASVNYKIWLDRFVQVCGDKNIEDYEISDFVKYRHWLESHFNPYSIQYATIIIKNLFQFFKQQNIHCLSPMLIKTPRIQAKSHRAITQNEYFKIISLIKPNEFRSLRDLIIIRLLWDTGVRVSELCDLEVSNINENKRSTVIHTKKTGKPRIIVWSNETHFYLIKYMAIRLELAKTNGTTSLFVGLVNHQGWSSRINCRSVQRMIRRYTKQAGIKERITPHSFRHGWAHKRRDNNAPLAFIQRGLGHINPISTFVYEQYNDTDFEQRATAYLNL